VHGLGKIEASLSDYTWLMKSKTPIGADDYNSSGKMARFCFFFSAKLATVLLKLAHKVRLKRFLKQPRSKKKKGCISLLQIHQVES
jgi:hypothetical protein